MKINSQNWYWHMQKSSLKQNHHFYSNSTLRVLQLTEFHLPPKYVYAALQFFFLCGKENIWQVRYCVFQLAIKMKIKMKHCTYTESYMSNKLCFTLRAGVYPSTSQLNRDITAWKVNMAGQWGQQVKRHFNHCSLSHVMMETYPQALCYRCNLFTYIMHTLQTSLEATIRRSVHKNIISTPDKNLSVALKIK